MTNLTLGDLLRRHRLEASLTQKELAELVGYDHTGISRFERSMDHTPKPEFIDRFIEALHLPTEEAEQLWDAYRRETGEAGPLQSTRRQDWGEAPDVSAFYGRYDDLVTLTHWLADEQCRLIALLGMGGIGKTALATKLARQTAEQFEYVMWRSLRNAPPLRELLTECIQFLSDQQEIDLPERIDKAITRLLHYLAVQRCLLILDNAEAILQEGQAGHYRPDYEDYGHLLQRLGESQHQSCVIVTSREKPREVGQLEGEDAPVRTHPLTGLQPDEGRQILAGKRLTGSTEAWGALVRHYSGNPLALNIVAEMIREVYDGDIDDFLSDEAIIFGRIGDVLAEQFARLSALEQSLMYWLAIEREPVSREVLPDNLVEPVSKRDLMVALRSLRRRSLVEQSGAEFTLQNVVMEYMTDRLVEGVCEEVTSGEIGLFNSHALMKATTKEYVRESQKRLILRSVAKRSLTIYNRQQLEERLKSMLKTTREQTPQVPGYLGGNIINLLCDLEWELADYDFSNLSIWQAYLQKTRLQNVNLANSDLSKSVFASSFGPIYSVTYSQDSELLAIGGNNRAIVWHRQSRKQLFILERPGGVGITISPDGRMVATTSKDQPIKLWDIDTGKCFNTLLEHTEAIIDAVVFSPDGQMLASRNRDCVKLWSINTGQCVKTLFGHNSLIPSVVFSPDGQMLASGSDDQSVKLWDVNTGACVKTLCGHTDRVWSVAFSSDGQILASGSIDRSVKLWDVKTGQCLETLIGNQPRIGALAYNPNGQLLASTTSENYISLWDVNTGQCIKNLVGHSNAGRSVAFSPDGQMLASGSVDKSVKLWNLKTGQCVHTLVDHSNRVWSVAYNPDGTILATTGMDDFIKLWDVEMGQSIKTLFGHTDHVWAAVFSPNGQMLASGSVDHRVKLWDVNTGECTKTLLGHKGWVSSVVFSPDGQILVSGSHDQSLKLWDVETGKCIKTLAEHKSLVLAVAFHPDAQIVASGSRDKSVKLWSVETG